jgi:uncharacterized protein (TIGR02145 family)
MVDSGSIGNNLSTNNKSGFSALPGGYRHLDGMFYDQGFYGYWWSATEGGASDAYLRNLGFDNGSLSRYNSNKSGGLSVRLVRD